MILKHGTEERSFVVFEMRPEMMIRSQPWEEMGAEHSTQEEEFVENLSGEEVSLIYLRSRKKSKKIYM